MPQTPIPSYQNSSIWEHSFPLHFPSSPTILSSNLSTAPNLYRCSSSSISNVQSASDVLAAFFNPAAGQESSGSSGCSRMTTTRFKSVNSADTSDTQGLLHQSYRSQQQQQHSTAVSSSQYGLLGETLTGSFRGVFSGGSYSRGTTTIRSTSFMQSTVDTEERSIVIADNLRVHRQFKTSLRRLQGDRPNSSTSCIALIIIYFKHTLLLFTFSATIWEKRGIK